MNNYINVRVQAHNHTKTFNSIKHNLRVIQSLSQNQSSTNSNYIMFDNKIIKITNENKKDIYKQLSETYQSERKEHNAIYKHHNKRNLRDIKSTWCEGVFTFSEQMKEDIKNKKYTYNDLVNVANNCLKEIAQTYDTNINYMVLHLDETTPHFHFSFSNYDDKGMSLYFANKNKDFLSKLQDIGAKHFSQLGIERGISKEVSGVNHQTIDKYWKHKHIQQKQQFIKINEQITIKTNNLDSINENLLGAMQKELGLNSLLENLNSQIEEDKVILSDISTKIKDLKVERETIKKDLDLSTNEKKALYNDITTQQNELRQLKSEVQLNIESNKNFKNILDSKIDNIITSSKKVFGGLDEAKLRSEIATLVKHYSKYDLQLKEALAFKENNKELLNDNDTLKSKLEKSNLDNSNLRIQLSTYRSEISKLKEVETKALELVETIKTMKDTHSKQIEELNDKLIPLSHNFNIFKDYLKEKKLINDFKAFKEVKDSQIIEDMSNSINNHNRNR